MEENYIIDVDYEENNLNSYKGIVVILNGREDRRYYSGESRFFDDTDMAELILKNKGNKYIHSDRWNNCLDEINEYVNGSK